MLAPGHEAVRVDRHLAMQVGLVLGNKRVLMGNEEPRCRQHPEIFREGRQPQGTLSRW